MAVQMIPVPVLCDSCGALFSGPPFPMGAGLTLKLSNNKIGPCPQCGSVGHAVEGTFEFVGDAVRRISDGFKIEDIIRLRAIFERAQQENATPAQVLSEIENDAALHPLAQWLSDRLTPRSAGDTYSLLGFLATAVFGIAQMMTSQAPAAQPGLSEIQIVEIASNAVAKAMLDAQAKIQTAVVPKAEPAAALARSTTPAAKVGRNDPCTCASGKKFKHCCGALH